MSDVTLYIWARPTSQYLPIASNLDHTWVSSFKITVNPEHQPDPKEGWEPPESYWYCWGSPHNVASHALGSGKASLTTANNISPYNITATAADAKHYSASTTSGAIDYYGLDGVCHHVANQVLFATGSTTDEPMRVQQAKGYPLSTFFFGTYGLNSIKWQELQQKYADHIKLPGDDFLKFMDQHVAIDQHQDLLEIRAKAHKKITNLRAEVIEKDFDFYPELGIIITEALYETSELLGHKVFYQLFPALEIGDLTWFSPETLIHQLE